MKVDKKNLGMCSGSSILGVIETNTTSLINKNGWVSPNIAVTKQNANPPIYSHPFLHFKFIIINETYPKYLKPVL